MKNISKKILSFVLVLVMLIPCVSYLDLSVGATSGTCGDNLTWTLDDNGTLTISGTGAIADYSSSTEQPWREVRYKIYKVVIKNYVTSIGKHTFDGCDMVKSVTMPNTVTSIGDYSFRGCKNLTSITIPSSVISIGDSAFCYCGITYISLSNSVTSIGDSAFRGCYFTSVNIPASVTSVSGAAFYDCTKLTTITVSENNLNFSSLNGVMFDKNKTKLIRYPAGKAGSSYTIPNTVVSIGEDAFSACNNLTSITIPDSVISIGDSAFLGCDFTSITLPSLLTFIGNSAFYSCSKLVSITIPDSVSSIGDNTFRFCDKLKTVILPKSLTSIGNSAFAFCFISSIIIPSSVTYIGDYAFFDCYFLEAITIPNSVTFIGENAFKYCPQSLTIYGAKGSYAETFADNKEIAFAEEYELGIGKDNLSWEINDQGTLVISGAGDMANYSTTAYAPWYPDRYKIKNVVIENGVTTIGEIAFCDCDNLISVTIPDSVISISNNTFLNCKSLTTITVSQNNTTYSSKDGVLFDKNQTKLILYPQGKKDVSYTIPNGVTSIEDYAFYYCAKLVIINIPDSVMIIPSTNKFLLDPVIYGSACSYAETYARMNGFIFKVTSPEYIEDKTPFDLKTDGYSFANSSNAFGYGVIFNTRIPLESYIAVFGDEAYQLRKSTPKWGGSCFGMSATAILFKEKILRIESYILQCISNINADIYSKTKKEWNSDKLYFDSYNYIDESNEIRKLIDRYQLWVFSESGTEWMAANRIWATGESNGEIVVQGSLENVLENYDNYIVVLNWLKSNKVKSHAVVIDTAREPNYLGNGWYRLYIYDPNNPYFGDPAQKNCACGRYIDVNILTNEWRTEVSVNSDFGSTKIGFETNGNYISDSKIFIYDFSSLPTSFDGADKWYYSEDSANTANVCCANATIYDNDKNIVLQIKDGEVIYKNDDIVIETDMGALDGEVMPSYTIELPFDEFTIDFKSEGTAQVFNEEYSYGFVSDEGGSATITASNKVKVNGTTDSTVDVVILNETDDETFTSVNVEVKNDGENTTSVALSKENELIVDNVNDSFDATIYWNGQENEYLIQNVAKSDVESKDIVEYALSSGEIVPNDIIDADITCETYFVYDGEAKTISPVVKYLGNVLTLGVDYVIEGNTSEPDVGTYVATITGMGKYTGTLKIAYSIVETPSFEGASLTLEDNLKINYKANASLIEEDGYRNPYVVFEMNGVETIANEYKIVDDKLVFEFADIVPHNMNDTIYATLYATHNGVEYASETVEYSVATYCYNTLEKYSSDEYAELRTLLVDLLNYGAASQVYMKYKTDALVNAKLTDEQKAWGTAENRTLETVQDVEYEKIDNPTVSWKSAGLNLEESIGFRFKIATDSIEGLTVKVTTSVGEMTIDSSKFKIANGGYYVFVEGMDASRMSEAVYLTVYKDGVAVSTTFRYSIESYAYKMQDNSDTALANLIKAMMKYGDSAKAIIN